VPAVGGKRAQQIKPKDPGEYLHSGLRNLLAQSVERWEIGGLGDLKHSHHPSDLFVIELLMNQVEVPALVFPEF